MAAICEKNKEDILKKVTVQSKLQSRLKGVFDSWPNLKVLTLKFMDYVHQDIQGDDGKTLLEQCLQNAISKYEQCPPDRVGTNFQVKLFIQGLLKESYRFVNYHVVTEKRPVKIWEPFNTSVIDFILTHKSTSIVDESYTTADPDTIKTLILARIISLKELKAIDCNMSIAEFFKDESMVAH